ncbi:MAG: hypothetical protein EPO26_07055 [Chloroflexota bacterium]|nr:MAG: hypothetical protein EPO26_07055 [Chloroflexota bacterium]
MKMLLAMLDDKIAGRVTEKLTERRYGVTRVDTVGGFLRRGNATLLVGVEDGEVKTAIDLMREVVASQNAAGEVGPVFVLKVDELERI